MRKDRETAVFLGAHRNIKKKHISTPDTKNHMNIGEYQRQHEVGTVVVQLRPEQRNNLQQNQAT